MKRLLTALALAGAAGLLLWGWTARTEASAHIPPGTQPVDLAPLLRGAQPAPQTEALLFQQTGLGPTGLYAVWRREGAQGVLAFQRQLFAPAAWQCGYGTLLTRQDVLASPVRLSPLETGDILVTPASHCLGWRNGHAALVVDAQTGRTLECGPDGAFFGLASAWGDRASFLVLRLAGASGETRARIAREAPQALAGASYSPTVGLFSPKLPGGQITATQCAHLVWAAFARQGYDLDATGGWLVTPRDIALSPLLEVVQVYGLPPGQRWP